MKNKPNSQRDRHEKKDRERIHHAHQRFLDRAEAKEENRILAAQICGGVKAVSKRFDALHIAKSAARKREKALLATTSLKDIVK